MKKFLIIVLATILMVLPVSAKAINLEDYNTLNLEEVLTAEQIEPEFEKYEENDKQVVIYLFRGQGCTFCRGFITFLNEIYEEEGDKFKVVSFETWNDNVNDSLLVETAEFMGVAQPEKTGVPFIVIGDQYFPGFTEEAYGDDVIEAINEEYEKDVDDRYDVFEAMENAKEEDNTSSGASIWAIIITGLIATAVIITYDTVRFNKLQNDIRKLANKKGK